MEDDAKFCPSCGYPLHNEEVQDTRLTEDQTELHYQNDIDDTSFYQRNKKVILAGIAIIVIVLCSVFGWKVYEESQYPDNCTVIYSQLESANRNFMDTTQQLSKADTDADVDGMIAAIEKDRNQVDDLVKAHSELKIPSKYQAEGKAIDTLLHKQADVYKAALFIIDNPNDESADKKMEALQTLIKESKDLAATVHMQGTDFYKAVNMDSLADYLKVYRDKIKKNTDQQDAANALAEAAAKDTSQSEAEVAKNMRAIRIFRTYHNRLSAHYLQAAYQTFSNNLQSQLPYTSWANGYESTISSMPYNVKVTASNSDSVTLSYSLKAKDRVSGAILVQYFNGTCTLVLENGAWKIDSLAAQKVSESYE